MVLLDLNEVKNPSIPVELIIRNFKCINQISIAINYNCKMARKILDMVNMVLSLFVLHYYFIFDYSKCSYENRCFSPPTHWFIFEENKKENSALKQLKNTKMYLDADISYVNFGQSRTTSHFQQYNSYDVYNHGSDMGGKLNVVFDRYIKVSNDGRAFQTKSIVYPKVRQRRLLQDVKLRIGIEVCYKIQLLL